ncbi:tRNA-dihydrouridine synthase family protein [Butyrivibrio sp. DSM 10294]|uniref:tRNA dihydrouridine synthase n=1 Tax=Butyrivibrio sp. DSM 10294 TaxID=2972457 RepID=UPI00234EC363|nr:tRNA-dihydrouridine synthase family protein [Butyrivibrio sp. DSM 10294]MDC7294172.1 tRNA-dihydrouridine synthase family protein [Butyrivibrio sp. DSM 10294]
MKFYFAPMEGITLYPLRNIHNSMFGDSIDKYYTPFITATHNFHFKKREKRDALFENSPAFESDKDRICAQIMAGRPDTFCWAAVEMKKLGYHEVNLNLGCPAPTVVNRHKGAGLLLDTEYLDWMLGEIFGKLQPYDEGGVDISLKTRLGFYDEDEAEKLMQIYAKYPISELTIHSRVREDYYKGEPRVDAYKKAVSIYRESGGTAPVCYNGNILSSGDESIIAEIADISDAVMLGRGIMENPALARELRGGELLSNEELKEYLEKLYYGFAEYIPEERNVIFKMLEHWAFLAGRFEGKEKELKAIRKSRSKGEYFAAVNNFFAK